MTTRIDTDKYEGHTPAPWNTDCAEPDAGLIANIDAHDRTVARMVNGCLADTQLLADAPLLLEAYKQLREGLYEVCNYLHHTNLENPDFKELMYKLEIFERDDDE